LPAITQRSLRVDHLFPRLLQWLLARDQLGAARRAKRAFLGFEEEAIAFPPTYRFDRESDVYDSSEKRRIPAYTDRILYKAVRCRDARLAAWSALAVVAGVCRSGTESFRRRR
jgi:hypothetical protein